MQSYDADRLPQGSGTVMNSYSLDNANIANERYDCIYYSGGAGSLIVKHDILLNPHEQTSAVFVEPYGGNLDAVTVENSILAGGGYTPYGGMQRDAGMLVAPVTVSGNRFSRLYDPASGYFGLDAYFNPAVTTWSGNVWDDTNQTVNGP